MSRIPDRLTRMESKRSPHLPDGGGNGLEVQATSDAADEAIPLPRTQIPPSHDKVDSQDCSPRSRLTTWSPDPNIMLSFASGASVNGTEDFRALRSRLHQLREQVSLKRVLVASALPREGRSFMAANLAQVMACQQRCRTLLLDADLRSPSLHRALGTSASPGLSDYLLGEAEESEIIQSGQIENLFFAAAGRPVSGQSELLSNGRLKTFLDGAGSLFDWIIIDSTAAMPVSDSGIIANYCHGTLLVVRSNSTPFDVVRKAREKLRPERILGVVLNEIRSESSGRSKGGYQEKVSDRSHEWKLDRNLSSSEPPIGGEPQVG